MTDLRDGRATPRSAQPTSAARLEAAGGVRHIRGMMIYKILRADEWAALQRDGSSPGAPIDVADGFVHLSTADQAPETAAKHFADVGDLTLAQLDADALGDDLRWEPSRGGQDFPHLYRDLSPTDVIVAWPLPLGPSGHVFPPEMV